MDANVRVKSLTFKSISQGVVSSVCFTLSDGKSSGVIEKAGVNHECPQTFEFDSSKPIKSVSASENRYAYRIMFIGKDGSVVYSYNPYRYQ